MNNKVWIYLLTVILLSGIVLGSTKQITRFTTNNATEAINFTQADTIKRYIEIERKNLIYTAKLNISHTDWYYYDDFEDDVLSLHFNYSTNNITNERATADESDGVFRLSAASRDTNTRNAVIFVYNKTEFYGDQSNIYVKIDKLRDKRAPRTPGGLGSTIKLMTNDSLEKLQTNITQGIDLDLNEKVDGVFVYWNTWESTGTIDNTYTNVSLYYNNTNKSVRIEYDNAFYDKINVTSLDLTKPLYFVFFTSCRTGSGTTAIANLTMTDFYISSVFNTSTLQMGLRIGDETSNSDSFPRNSWENTTKQFNNFLDDLTNTALSCSCTDCSISGENCTLPFNFVSNYTGTFTVDNLIINYSINEINNCTRGLRTLNITTLNESDDTAIVTDIRVTLEYSDFNFNATYNNLSTTHAQFCVWPNGTNTSATGQIDYNYGTNYFSYFIDTTVFTNITRTINLYVTDGTTLVTFNVKDTNGNNVEDAYIIVDKYDVGSNTYKTVEVLNTDNSGDALGNIVLNTAWYRFTINYEGDTKLIDTPSKVYSTTKNFRIDLIGGDWYDDYETVNGVNFNLTFNNATKNFRLIYNDPNLQVTSVCLKVDRKNVTGDVNINTTCLSTHSGTILINIGTDVDNKVYLATAYARIIRSPATDFILAFLQQEFLSEWRFFNDQDSYGVYMTYLTSVGLIMVGIWNPIVAILLGIIGFIAMALLGVFYMGWPLIVTLIVLGGLVIYKINNSR